MNVCSAVLLAAALSVAVGDWWAVQRRNTTLEYVCKPLAMALLIGFVATADVDNGVVRSWFVVALVFSLVGDVLLMLPRDRFVPGLVSFLLAHLGFIAGLWVDGVRFAALAIGVAFVAIAVAVVGPRIIGAVRASDHRDVAVPVGAYMGVISIMVASAVGTGNALAVVGASLFFCSDAMIAWARFVRAHDWHRVAIMVTYHLAQTGLALSLLT